MHLAGCVGWHGRGGGTLQGSHVEAKLTVQ